MAQSDSRDFSLLFNISLRNVSEELVNIHNVTVIS